MPPRRAVELRVGGQTYRVVATGDDHRVQHLAELVDRKFAEVVPNGLGRNVTAQQAMFLTAMALAAEVEEQQGRATTLEGERDRSLRLANRARDVVARLLERVDNALANVQPPGAAPSEARSAREVASSSASPDARDARDARPREAGFPSPPPRTPLKADDDRDDDEADPDILEDDDALLDTASPLDHLTDPLDRLTDPPDAIHEPLLIDPMTPPPPTLRQSAPVNTTRSPGVTSKPLTPGAASKPLTPGVTSKPLPAAAAPAPAHRGGLRLVRQAGTPPDDDTR